jgi:hypothetical protein
MERELPIVCRAVFWARMRATVQVLPVLMIHLDQRQLFINCTPATPLLVISNCFSKSECRKGTRELSKSASDLLYGNCALKLYPIHRRRNPHGRYCITEFSSAHLALNFRQWHYTGWIIGIAGSCIFFVYPCLNPQLWTSFFSVRSGAACQNREKKTLTTHAK